MTLLTRQQSRRRGTSAVEFALVAPILFMLLVGLMIGGLEVFRYQQVATLTRDCARYASVHGAKWAQANNNGTLTTADDIFTNVVGARGFVLDLPTVKANSTVTWDDTTQMPTTTSGQTNRVHVTIKFPLGADTIPFVGSLFQNTTLQSSCERAVTN
jgi:Flp pilus assembly protein TadG